jgi:hypothetical protein
MTALLAAALQAVMMAVPLVMMLLGAVGLVVVFVAFLRESLS